MPVRNEIKKTRLEAHLVQHAPKGESNDKKKGAKKVEEEVDKEEMPPPPQIGDEFSEVSGASDCFDEEDAINHSGMRSSFDLELKLR